MTRDTQQLVTDSGDASQPADDDAQDPDQLRDRITELERDLAARETQVQALRERYETVLDERKNQRPTASDNPVRDLLTRVRTVLS
ncbi:hypothetical protein [Haloarchaeobius sp. TZWWS8]|uniref:hypothetical protein n=1 Tax=Haloarchaeobius sp. TZWWS8 TaxID=3446121 RepID=UPI003EB6C4BD